MPRNLILLGPVLLAACGEGSDAPPPPLPHDVVADLRADANRDGEVTFDERDADKLSWNAQRGAVFLANIDDDAARCDPTVPDVDLPECHDAANDVVDGAEDAKDLARLFTRPWPEAPEDASATIGFAGGGPPAKLFLRVGSAEDAFVRLGEDGLLSLEQIRAGVELGIEATDIVRDPAVWDGYAVVRLTVTARGRTVSDDVQLRVAPLLTSHHLQPAEEIFVGTLATEGSVALKRDLAEACSASGAPVPTGIVRDDPWVQDFFETAWMSLPARSGGQHVMHVTIRSPNVDDPSNQSNPLRAAGRFAFENRRGRDRAAIQQFDMNHDLEMQTLNSTGNLETIPPYTKDGVSYPFGRMLLGSTPSFYPDPTFVRMLEAQAMQPMLRLDTSWLLVAHVDETVSFVHANTPRGWALLVNDPRLARTMLEDLVAQGHGATPMFVGKTKFDFATGDELPAQVTIEAVLADTDVMTATAEAAVEVDAQLEVLKRETGVTDEEIVRVPFLHTKMEGRSVAFQPGTVNGLYVADRHFVAPRPHGPRVEGKDPFEEQLRAALGRVGVQVHFAEAWEYHVGGGDVHCGTNARRRVPSARWWESGR